MLETMASLGCQLTPLVQARLAVLFEDLSAIEMSVEIEMIVDRGMDGSEFLPSL